MKNKKNNIANKIFLEIFVKVGIFSLIYLVLLLLAQFVYSQMIGNFLYQNFLSFYLFLMNTKGFIVIGVYIIVVLATLYLVLRKYGNAIHKILDAIDKILKHEETLITLPKGYQEVENQLNSIQIQSLHNEQVAKEAEQRKNDLVMYLAHDLKTPLTSTIGYLSLLDENPEFPLELRKKYTSIALHKSQRLEDLINEFFEITRFNLQHIVLENTKLNLTLLLKQLVDEYEPVLQQKQLTCELINHETEDIMICADSNKLARVIDNILKNAMNYSDENTNIKVQVEKTEKFIHIQCINKGAVIPEHRLQTIFEKFYRLDSSRSSGTGGSGLGLAIAKEIVTQYGGTIYASSNEEQTIFTIELPSTILIKS